MKMRTAMAVIGLCALLVLLSGCLVITVDPQLDNPYQITLCGVEEIISVGEQMTVTAMVKDENGCPIFPDKYEWYLRGSLLPAKCGTIVIGKELKSGLYTLDVIVSKDGVPSSEGAVFEVVEQTE